MNTEPQAYLCSFHLVDMIALGARKYLRGKFNHAHKKRTRRSHARVRVANGKELMKSYETHKRNRLTTEQILASLQAAASPLPIERAIQAEVRGSFMGHVGVDYVELEYVPGVGEK